MVMDDADFAASSTVVGAPPFEHMDEARLMSRLEQLSVIPRLREAQPRLLALRRAEVGNLTVSNVDLRACRFTGATNLDRLRIEGRSVFAETPRGWRTTRQMLAEEHHWHYVQTHSATANSAQMQHSEAPESYQDWYPEQCRPPLDWPDFEQPTAPDPHEITVLYRHLRKGREDSRDEPGAADFYYGEMQMRRKARKEDAKQAQGRPGRLVVVQAERLILWLYWLFSGYALRAWRAAAGLIGIWLLSAFLFAYGGGFVTPEQPSTRASSSSTLTTTGATRAVSPSTSPKTTASRTPTTITPLPPSSPSTTAINPPTTTGSAKTSFGGALIFAARTVVGLSRDPQPQLTWWGDLLQILLRILGPSLLALAVLSIRGRVKR